MEKTKKKNTSDTEVPNSRTGVSQKVAMNLRKLAVSEDISTDRLSIALFATSISCSATICSHGYPVREISHKEFLAILTDRTRSEILALEIATTTKVGCFLKQLSKSTGTPLLDLKIFMSASPNHDTVKIWVDRGNGDHISLHFEEFMVNLSIQ